MSSFCVFFIFSTKYCSKKRINQDFKQALSWQNVDDIVHTLPDEDTKDYKIMFGIREGGVDFDNMITNNINGTSLDKGLAVYTGGIYMMEIHIEKYESYWESPKMFVKFGEVTLKEI